MKLKKLIAAGLMATMPFALGACADDGDDVGDTIVDDTVLDETVPADDGLTETTMAEDMTETTMAEDTSTETTG